MNSSNNICLELEDKLQDMFILTLPIERVEIRDCDSRFIRVLGYIGIVLVLPIWVSIWLLDNFVFLVYCFRNGFDYKVLSFTSFNDGTPYHLVGRITNRIKVEICCEEHPPPHFHVFVDGIKHSFRIDDCEHINGGKLDPKIKKKIKKWYLNNRNSIITMWNETRTKNCKVGEYIGK